MPERYPTRPESAGYKQLTLDPNDLIDSILLNFGRNPEADPRPAWERQSPLLVKIREGGPTGQQAQKKLVRLHEYFLALTAHPFKNYGKTSPELLGEASVALVKYGAFLYNYHGDFTTAAADYVGHHLVDFARSRDISTAGSVVRRYHVSPIEIAIAQGNSPMPHILALNSQIKNYVSMHPATEQPAAPNSSHDYSLG